ncbi:MAG: hypothetical protein ACLFS3_01245 [Candidatus Aenigmatarchaeota archaeon]
MVGLNDYRDEVRDFLEAVDSEGEDFAKDIERLEKEFRLLKEGIDNDDRLRHQIYDMLFALFSLAVKKDLDLDKEWMKGREKKRKYMEQP